MSRRRFLGFATGIVAGIGGTLAALPFARSLNPAKYRVRPFIDIGIEKLQPGEMTVGVWRQKPVFVIRRTDEQVKNLRAAGDHLLDSESHESLQPDYARNFHRSRDPELFVALGMCTHLGCAPVLRSDAGAADLGGSSWQGGLSCPCHGAKYDLAGRVFRGGPAPKNLEIPYYEITTVPLNDRINSIG